MWVGCNFCIKKGTETDTEIVAARRRAQGFSNAKVLRVRRIGNQVKAQNGTHQINTLTYFWLSLFLFIEGSTNVTCAQIGAYIFHNV